MKQLLIYLVLTSGVVCAFPPEKEPGSPRPTIRRRISPTSGHSSRVRSGEELTPIPEDDIFQLDLEEVIKTGEVDLSGGEEEVVDTTKRTPGGLGDRFAKFGDKSLQDEKLSDVQLVLVANILPQTETEDWQTNPTYGGENNSHTPRTCIKELSKSDDELGE